MSKRDSVIDPSAETMASADEQAEERGPALALDETATDPKGRPGPAGPAPQPLTGKKLAHFQVGALIGRGGMGEVYQATDLALDRQVAIKVISPDVAQDPKLRRRFFREARSQARLQHANVCHIYYIGEEDGLLFFAMEHIDGESLSKRIERDGAMPVGEALECCRMAALGLREAFRAGFTHRDVKPSNLMVDRNGTVKVVDFGLVKESDAPGEGLSGDAPTIEGTTVVGTPLYMAPEQAKGEPVDFRADVYALGATLHHLVSGEPPFQGPTAMAIVSRHLTETRPRLEPRRSARRGPAPIDALCDRMMAKEPDGRFTDYDDLLTTIENASPARTRPAGFWVRAFALTLDLLFVQIMTMALGVVLPVSSSMVFGCVALVYSVLCHGRWGQTLGKAALEIEVAPAERPGPPGFSTAAMRFLAQAGLLYMLAGAALLCQALSLDTMTSVVYGITVAVVLLLYPLEGALTAWLIPNKRTLWDRASGTRVRYRRLKG